MNNNTFSKLGVNNCTTSTVLNCIIIKVCQSLVIVQYRIVFYYTKLYWHDIDTQIHYHSNTVPY